MIQIGTQVNAQGRTGEVAEISGEWFFVKFAGIRVSLGFRAGRLQLV